MRRLERQTLIKQLISQHSVTSQSHLQDLLKAEGVLVTQATLSRDIREMGLVRLHDAQGKRQYSLPKGLNTFFPPTAYDLIKGASRAEFMLVLRTELGHADVLANVIDGAARPDILGTVAGADTLLVICQDAAIAASYELALSPE